jgi:Flp pilus assembly protein TadG
MFRTRRGRRQGGQALVELAISVPVLLWLLLGAFDASVMVSDKVIAGYATRQGARLAAETGGSETNNPPANQASIDQNIVQNVLAVASAMNYSSLQEIDIYAPRDPSGVFNPGTDFYSKFTGTGSQVSSNFPLNFREQIPPNETSIGVRLTWIYRPPTGFATFTITLQEFTVMKAAPVLL